MARGQGALEYIIIIAAILGISAVVVLATSGIFSSQSSTAYIGTCKQAAVDCKASKLLSPNDPCKSCAVACMNSATGEEIFDGAITCCTKAYPDMIYAGSLGCATACGDSKVESPEECELGQTCANGEPCSSDCTCPIICGDGILSTGEECDDGNYIFDDGCSRVCTIEVPCSDSCSLCSACVNGECTNHLDVLDTVDIFCSDIDINCWMCRSTPYSYCYPSTSICR